MKISQAKNHQTDEKGILKARSVFAQLRKIRPHEEHPGFSCGRKFCILLQTKNCLAESRGIYNGQILYGYNVLLTVEKELMVMQT